MSSTDKELINEFIVESQEGLANIEQQMLAIEAGGADVDLDLVNAVFRTMHTIKGTAGFLGLTSIGTLAHGLEEVLDEMRNRELVPSCDLVNSILRAADFIKGLIESVESSNEVDIGEYVSELQDCRRRSVAGVQAERGAESSGGDELPSAGLGSAVQECYELVERVNRELLAAGVHAPTELTLREMYLATSVIRQKAAAMHCGAVLKVCQAVENVLKAVCDGERSWDAQVSRALCEGIAKCREGVMLAEIDGNDSGLAVDDVLRMLATLNTPATARSDIETKPEDAPATPKTSPESRNASAAATSEGNIRVDVALLDKLMTRVGELVLARNQVLQYCNGLNDPAFLSTANGSI
ncbi:MAG: Hpt domain-containing protein [Pirellulales bacterium]